MLTVRSPAVMCTDRLIVKLLGWLSQVSRDREVTRSLVHWRLDILSDYWFSDDSNKDLLVRVCRCRSASTPDRSILPEAAESPARSSAPQSSQSLNELCAALLPNFASVAEYSRPLARLGPEVTARSCTCVPA